MGAEGEGWVAVFGRCSFDRVCFDGVLDRAGAAGGAPGAGGGRLLDRAVPARRALCLCGGRLIDTALRSQRAPGAGGGRLLDLAVPARRALSICGGRLLDIAVRLQRAPCVGGGRLLDSALPTKRALCVCSGRLLDTALATEKFFFHWRGAEAGSRPAAGHFLLLRQKKLTKEKATRQSESPSGHAAVLAKAGSARTRLRLKHMRP